MKTCRNIDLYCLYCHEVHPIGYCSAERTDKLHAAASLDPHGVEEFRSYGSRLEEGFAMLCSEEDSIVDKFGYTHGSGIC